MTTKYEIHSNSNSPAELKLVDTTNGKEEALFAPDTRLDLKALVRKLGRYGKVTIVRRGTVVEVGKIVGASVFGGATVNVSVGSEKGFNGVTPPCEMYWAEVVIRVAKGEVVTIPL